MLLHITKITSDDYCADAANALRMMRSRVSRSTKLHDATFREMCAEAGMRARIIRYLDGVWIHLERA